MALTTCELPDQVAIDRTEQQLARLCAVTRAFNSIKDVFDLGAREIGISQQTRFLRDGRLEPFVP